jgi:uncharacterized protein YjbI with pentapeptide repeats
VNPSPPTRRSPPLPAPHEGICILDLQLHQPGKIQPTPLLHVAPAQPIAYALIRAYRADPQLALAATALAHAPGPTQFRALCREHQATLARASREFADVELVQRRWDRLAKGARGIHDIEHLRRLASDLWLPDDVLSLPEIEHVLATGAIQVLRGLAERAVSEQDRKECTLTLQLLERASERLSVDKERANSPDARALRELVVHILAPPHVSATTAPIRADGSVAAWVSDPGAPPAQLLGAGFQLWPRVHLDVDDLADARPGAQGPAELVGYLEDLDVAATWLAIQGSPPSWVGWSPRQTPVLVIAPGHIILVSHVIPPPSDLALARANASKPLQVALLIGQSETVTVKLPPDLSPLPKAIRSLAIDDEHLRELADFEYSPARLDFIEPTCLVGFEEDPPLLNGIAALDSWFTSGSSTAVLCGSIGDGRTTLVRVWLADLARTALLGDGTPVLYVDGASWREHSNLSSLLSRFAPARLAALRLAVSTGNCLIVLDGFDDVRPDKFVAHPFFRGWLSAEALPQLLIVSCWPESTGDLIQLRPISDDEPWPKVKNRASLGVLPRAIVAAARSRQDLVRPPPALLHSLLAGYTTALTGVTKATASATADPSPLALVLGDLARALWRPRATQTFAAIAESEFRRLRAEWRPRGGEPDRLLRLLESMEQDLLAFTSEPQAMSAASPRWRWLAHHAAFRSPPASVPSRRGDQRLISFALDPLVDFVLAETLVRSLAEADQSPLDTLPLFSDTIHYCLQHPRWSEARATLQSVLGTEQSTPTISLNALLLACADEMMTSTEEAPWKLAGLDLRRLDLTGARLAHADLQRAKLSYTSLRRASLHHANLSDSLFEGADLRETDLTHALLTRARITGARIDSTRFAASDLGSADLSRSVAPESAPDFTEAHLAGLVAHAAGWSGDLASNTPWFTGIDPDPIDEVIAPPVTHEGAIAWSSDDNLIAIGDVRGNLWLWASGPLRGIAHHPAHTQTIRAIAFSPDGRLIATSADNDNEVRLWSTSNLRPIETLPHDKPVTGLFWEAPETLWTFTGTPHRWDLNTRTPEFFASIKDAYEGLVTEDRSLLVTITRDKYPSTSISIQERATQQRIATMETTTIRLPAVDGRRNRILIETDRSYKIHQLASDLPLVTKVDMDEMGRFALSPYPCDTWSPSGGLIATIDLSRRLRLNDTANGALRRTLGKDLLGALFANRQDRVFALSDRELAVYDAETGIATRSRLPKKLGDWARDLCWTPKGLRFHTEHLFVNIDLERATFQLTTYKKTHRLGGNAADLNHARSHYIFSDGDGYALWSLDSKERKLLDRPPHALEGHNYYGAPLACWSPDDTLVMIQRSIGEGRAEFTIWDTRTGSCIHHDLLPGLGSVLLLHARRIYPLIERSSVSFLHCISLAEGTCISVCADSLELIFANKSGTHCMFVSRYTRLSLLPTASLVNALSAMPTGDRREVKLGDVRSWSVDISTNIGDVVLGPQELVAVVTCYEVHLYSITDGKHLHSFSTRFGVATALAFTPDGKHLACHFYGEVLVWSLERRKMIAHLVLLEDGAVAIAGLNFQRLITPDGTSPSLDGFYARSGVQLHPLDRLAHLESKTLCADLWKTISSPDPHHEP